MEFECDPKKNAGNQRLHGIIFDDAKALLDDPDLLEIPARTEDEPRFLIVGRVAGEYWSGVITYRERRIRIISIRRSRKEEIAYYKS